MNWQLWVVVGMMTTSALITVSKIGQERKPTTPGEGVAVVIMATIFNLLVVWGAYA